MQSHNIIERLGRIEDIPPLPALASKIIETCFDDKADFHQMAGLIKQDPVLTARILTMINSPAFALTTTIKDLSHAISLLGKNQVRNLALSVAIFDTFTGDGKNSEREMAAFWQHCIACACASEELAKALNYPQPEEAFIAGLLHDIGKLVAYHKLGKEYKQFIDTLKNFTDNDQPKWPQLDLEKEILGASHHLIGKWAAEAWNFPTPIVEAVWLHHQPPASSRQETPDLPLLVRLADAICNLYNLGSSYFVNHELDYSTSAPYARTIESLKTFFRIDQVVLLEIYHTTDYYLNEFGNCLTTVDNELYFRAIHKAKQELGRLNLEREQSLAQLALENRLLEGLAAINRKSAEVPRRLELINEIVTQTLNLCQSKKHFAFCGLAATETDAACWLGHFGKIKFSDKELISNSFISENSTSPGQTKILTTLQHLINNKPAALLRNNRVTPLKEHPAILVIPICDHQNNIRQTIYGQLFIDCQQLGRCGIKKSKLIKALTRFATGISEIVERFQMNEKISGQAEAITELNRKSEDIYHDLLQAQRLATVGRLAAGAAHEINNPLTVISGQLQILQTQLENSNSADEKTAKRYEKMLNKVDKISRITKDLLAYGRPQKAQTREVVLNDLVKQAVDAVIHRQGFKNIKFSLNLPAELPNLLADPQQIGQILINLLINAQLAMPESGSIGINAAAITKRKLIKINLSDTGCGISPENLPTIFDPFFTTRDQDKGTGLGLSIVHTLVQANNGLIEVQSTLNKGTTFTIFLPMVVS